MHTQTKSHEPPSAGRRLVSLDELSERFGITYSRSQLHRLGAEGKFPKPLKLGAARGSRRVWVEDDILAWLDELVANRDAEVDHD